VSACLSVFQRALPRSSEPRPQTHRHGAHAHTQYAVSSPTELASKTPHPHLNSHLHLTDFASASVQKAIPLTHKRVTRVTCISKRLQEAIAAEEPPGRHSAAPGEFSVASSDLRCRFDGGQQGTDPRTFPGWPGVPDQSAPGPPPPDAPFGGQTVQGGRRRGGQTGSLSPEIGHRRTPAGSAAGAPASQCLPSGVILHQVGGHRTLTILF